MIHNKQIEDWIKLAGGKENIKLVEHNQGTTTLVLKSSTLVNMSVVVSTDHPVDIRVTEGQCYLEVSDESSMVYNALLETEHLKKHRFSVLKFVSDVFRPLMPVILGAAVIKILLAIVTLIHTYSSMNLSALMDSQTFTIFKMIGESIFYLLPVLVAMSTAYRLKSNMYVAASIGGFMFYPEIARLLSGEEEVHFLGLPLVSQPAFYSTAIWAIITISAAACLERALERLSSNVFKGMLAPLLTFLIVVPVSLMLLGLVGTWVDEWIPKATDSLIADAPVVAVMLLGAIFSLMLITGLHYWLLPVLINEIVINGSSMIIPAMLVAIVGQAGASFACGLRSKESANRSLAFVATGTALLGVVEPAIYAVNMSKRSFFYSALMGGAAGGLCFGLVAVRAFAISGNPSLLEIPVFVEEGSLNLLNTCVGVVIAFGVSAMLAYWMAGKTRNNTHLSPSASE